MPKVFVSYSRDDQRVARRFAEGFQAAGLSVWWDQSLNPGEAFDQVTERALDDAKAVVVLWSRASVNSRWVRAEATQANANNRLVPVMIETCKRPIMFELTHTADLSDWDGSTDDPAWQAFLVGVQRFVQRASPDSPESAPVAQPPKPAVTGPVRAVAKTEAASPPRRRALLLGASAVGVAAAGFAGGMLFTDKGGIGGGAPVAPAFQRLTFRRGLIRSARFAPDGQTIFYGALWDGDLCRAHSTRIDNPESQPLNLPHANVLAVSRSGELAIALGPNLAGIITYGTLARVPIAGGAPRELADNVKFADWSGDGTELAVIRYVADRDRLEYPLGKVLFQPPDGAGTGLGFVRIAPDGRRLAFVHFAAPQSLFGKVCVVDAGGKVTVLTDEYVNIHGLVWRDDEIWYSASDDRPLYRAIMAVRPGAAPRVVARLPVNVTLWDSAADKLLLAQTDDRSAMLGRLPGDTRDRDLSWLDASVAVDISRDARSTLFMEIGQGVGPVPVAYLRGMDGSPAVRLGSGEPLALSPDTQWALIRNANRLTAGSGDSIDLVPTGAGETRRLANGEGWRLFAARWRPDGRRIIVRAAERGRRVRLYQLEVPGGQLQPVTPEGVGDWALSPDGAVIAAWDPEGVLRLYPVDGGATRVVPGANGIERLLAWINEGLLVTRGDDPSLPRGELHVLDPATGRFSNWGNILPGDSAGIMLLNSFVATPDGHGRVASWHRSLSNLYLATGLQ